MDLTQIQEAVKGNDELRKSIVKWATNETEEGKEMLSNFANAEFDKRIGEKVSEIHLGYDNDIFEILGERKEASQKTYDYVKQLTAELKELRAKKGSSAREKELEAELTKLKNDGSHNDHWKKTFDEESQKWIEEKKALQSKLEERENEFRRTQISAELQTALSGLKFKESIPKEAIDAIIAVNSKTIEQNAKIIDGKVVFHKEDGTQWMNDEYKAISAIDVVKSFLNPMIDDGNQPKGGGAPQNVGKGKVVGQGDKARLVLDPSSFSTKTEFTAVAQKALSALGIARGAEYNRLIDEARKEYKVEELDLY